MMIFNRKIYFFLSKSGLIREGTAINLDTLKHFLIKRTTCKYH